MLRYFDFGLMLSVRDDNISGLLRIYREIRKRLASVVEIFYNETGIKRKRRKL